MRSRTTTTARRAGVTFRFPCGHLESEKAVTARVRTTATAAWVACLRCTLIAVVVTPARPAEAARTSSGAWRR